MYSIPVQDRYQKIASMIFEKREALRCHIVELMAGAGINLDKDQQNLPGKIVLLYDQLLYEAAGKKIPYQTYREIFKMYNGAWSPNLTYKEAAKKYDLPASTVFQIAQGKYWQ
jgi:hypothetical protein